MHGRIGWGVVVLLAMATACYRPAMRLEGRVYQGDATESMPVPDIPLEALVNNMSRFWPLQDATVSVYEVDDDQPELLAATRSDAEGLFRLSQVRGGSRSDGVVVVVTKPGYREVRTLHGFWPGRTHHFEAVLAEQSSADAGTGSGAATVIEGPPGPSE